MTLLHAIQRTIHDVQRLTTAYHDETQRFLHDVKKVTERINDAMHASYAERTTSKQRIPSRYTFNTTTAKTLRRILDGHTSHRWTNRLDDFTTTLPAGFDEADAAYLHGYLDAQRYLPDQHPGLKDKFHRRLYIAAQENPARSKR